MSGENDCLWSGYRRRSRFFRVLSSAVGRLINGTDSVCFITMRHVPCEGSIWRPNQRWSDSRAFLNICFVRTVKLDRGGEKYLGNKANVMF
jgi:hypothetical protein